MKQIRLLAGLILLIAALISMSACKTTEENYRKAYQSAVDRQNEGYTDDELASMAREEAIPRSVFKGDSIPLKGIYVNTVKLDPPTPAAERYNVVVATFKQKFNALSVLDRLRQGGYTDARLLVDKDQLLYVAAVSTPSLDEAVAALRELQKSSPVALRAPCPYILRKP